MNKNLGKYIPAHAPYNFVPFHTKNNAAGARPTERICLRYSSLDELPRHDIIDPALKTGEIHVSMTAETPVFVSDDQESFFRGANGALMIPGSTVRGMLRQNMQVLGYGAVRPGEDMEDQRILFRAVAAGKETTGRDLNRYYKTVLGMEDRRFVPEDDRIPENVEAGYLYFENGSYYICPTIAPVIRVRRDDPALVKAQLDSGYAKMETVAYTLDGHALHTVMRTDEDSAQGVLLYTGRPINSGKGPSAVYLFPAADRGTVPLKLTGSDVLSYQADLEGRKNSLKAYYDPSFWDLPKEKKAKPVFYVCHNGHVYFGMTAHPRIGYINSLAEGLPDRDGRLREDEIPLDYPHAVFGFAGKEHSYRSRVSVSDFPAQDDPGEGDLVRIILGQPKPSWYPGYVTNGDDYNASDFALRGFKHYWQKDVDLSSAAGGKDSVKSQIRPLPAGTVFRGVIRYKNLHPDELGLLLWALRLEAGCRQSLGMARPFGFGRMCITIDSLLEYDVQKLYTSDGFCAGPDALPPDAVEKYIRRFDAYICSELHIKKPTAREPSICSQEDIQDFFFMHRPMESGEDTSYVELPDYRRLSSALPSVRQIRERAKKSDTGAENTTADPNDWEAILRKRFSGL